MNSRKEPCSSNPSAEAPKGNPSLLLKPELSRVQVFFGVIAWLIVYGGGTVFLIYMLWSLLLD